MSKDSNRAAIGYIVNGEDDILMGKRNDNEKWTVPAGGIHVNECPFEGMARELKEETGLDAKCIKLIKVGKKGKMMLYLFEIKVDSSQEIDVSGDPDEECDDWEYKDPNDIKEDLHVPVDENWVIDHWLNT